MTEAALPRALALALAEELVFASNMLNDLAYDLGSNGETLRRHMASIQRIDYVTQIQLAVAGLLRVEGASDADIGTVTLQDMADRLRSTLASLEERSAAA
ncbi:hypothetical protein KZ813_03955 [Sphingomonas sp. RHCKR7]|uniref:hypothetical protein n=1 Tax=Sphingomonas folli TaxID=2862497 RepID=UPI001CA4BCCA|nr:hypothetical protein [Sphingomonas folli]MBW6525983.1 hypothetical protein [Sphingomonas folli]